MFGTIKKAAVIAAVAATGAVMAPSVASANVWQADNPVVKPYSGAAHIGGTLTLTLASGATTTCTVTATTNLTNPGGVAAGSISIFRLGVPAGGTCTTNQPNCTVTAAANSLPWSITTSGSNVTISGISFTNTYGGGASCAFNGLALTATGSITGSTTAGSNAITFTNAPGLTTPLGAATVNGTVRANVENATGGPNTSRPITLVP